MQLSSRLSFPLAHRASSVPAALMGGVSAPFNPSSISGLRSRLLDAATFTSPISSKYYLRDTTVENTHLPRQGRCWLFDGINDFGSGLTITATSWTFCCFVKVPSSNTASFRRIFDVGSLRIVAAINDSDTKISLFDGAWRTGATSLTRGSWVHLAYVFDGTLKLYCNGVEDYAGVGGRTISSEAVVLGSQTGNIGINSSIYDARVYSSAKTAGEVAAIYNQSRTGSGTFDTTGLLAAYPCNEESGTTGYDISGNGNHLTLTNITQATFHAADTGVLANPNNADGYRLSGSVYIPKRLTDSLAADGNALTVTGRAAYHGCAETPCFTGNGSNTSITISSVLASITGDFEFTGWYKPERSYGALWGNTNNGLYHDNLSTILRLYVAGTNTQFTGITLVIGQWHFWKVTRISGTVSMWIDGVALTRNAGPAPNNGTITVSTIGNGFSGFSMIGSVSDFRFTIDGVTTYFPLQDGPGSSNTNRDIAWVKSDGTGGVISNAIVNGTVSTIWGNRVPGNVEDWCVKYGGRIATNGAFVPGMLAGGNAADGSAKTLTAGKFGNPFSRLNLNPASAAELNGRSVPTAAVAGADINSTITPIDSAFRRTASDGDDRILIFDDTLSGADLTNVEGYVA